MNLLKISTMALCLLGAISLSSCIDDDEPHNVVEKEIVTVSPYTMITGSTPSGSMLEVLAFEMDGNDPYYPCPMTGIEGFEFDEGYRYSLLLYKTTIANPPADGSSVSYKLLKVVSKTDFAVSRENILLYVSGETGEYFSPTVAPSSWSCRGLRYRESESSDWQVGALNRVHGFNFEEGYNYVLSVRKTSLPEMDSYTYRDLQTVQYKLLDVVKKEKMN